MVKNHVENIMRMSLFVSWTNSKRATACSSFHADLMFSTAIFGHWNEIDGQICHMLHFIHLKLI